jgi:ketosteroid isomerase-like protein
MIDIDAEKKEIKQVGAAAFDAEDHKDVEGLLSFCTEDIILQIPTIPQLQGIPALRKYYNRFFPRFESLKGAADYIEVSSAGDMAWEYGLFTVEYKRPEGTIFDQGKYLLVWRKVNNQWKIAGYSVSSNQRPKRS